METQEGNHKQNDKQNEHATRLLFGDRSHPSVHPSVACLGRARGLPPGPGSCGVA